MTVAVDDRVADGTDDRVAVGATDGMDDRGEAEATGREEAGADGETDAEGCSAGEPIDEQPHAKSTAAIAAHARVLTGRDFLVTIRDDLFIGPMR